MIKNDKFEELEKLLSSIEDEGGSPERYEQLNRLLHGDPEACEFYISYQSLIAALDQTFAAQPVELADEERPENLSLRTTHMIVQASPRVATTKWNNPWWVGAAASLMATGMIVGLFALSNNGGEKSAAGISGNEWLSEDGVALMSRTLDAEFSGEPPHPEASDILGQGPVELEEGFAQIEFYNGARVLVEGPAKLDLLDQDSLFLSSGRIRAQVPPQAQSLRVVTPQAELTGSGGEFGLIVDNHESTELHHFDGKVEYTAGKSAPASHTAGDALFIASDGIAEYLEEADSKKFISWVDVLQSSRADAHRRYRDWRISTGDIMGDPRVRVYYTFDDQEPGDRMLVNQAGTSSLQDGAVVGSRWTQGRWRDKGALNFGRSSDRVRFSVDGNSDSMTFVTWVRFDRATGRAQVLLSPDSGADGVPHWRVDEKGKLQLQVPVNGGKKLESVASTPAVLSRKSQGRWHHLATVVDAKSKKVSHYFDGKPAGSSILKSQPDLRLGRVQLGNMATVKGQKVKPSFLSGRMDEFVLFADALSAEEIAGLYKIGKPR